MSSSHKVSCFKIPRKLKALGVDVEEFVEDYLQDDGELLQDRKDEILGMLREAAAKTKSKTKKAKTGPLTIMDRLVEEASKQEGEENVEPSKKKVKKEQTEEEEEIKSMVPVYLKYFKAKVPELKDILRWNKQLISGPKMFVLFKVIDGELHGRLSLCPLCQGDLKYIEGDYDTIHCNGRYDEGKYGTAIARSTCMPYY